MKSRQGEMLARQKLVQLEFEISQGFAETNNIAAQKDVVRSGFSWNKIIIGILSMIAHPQFMLADFEFA